MTSPNAASPEASSSPPPGLPAIDVAERGGKRNGEPQAQNRRLFMQLLVFDGPAGSNADNFAATLARAFADRHIPFVAYADVQQPLGVGLLTWNEDPAHFVRAVRPALAAELANVKVRPSFSMLGRTYAIGHEPDLEHALLRRSVENVQNPSFPWHVWYPLRRHGAFNRLPPEEVGPILREHAQIGMAYGQADLAHDIRLACHGLDANDNDFVIGLVGRDLHPLSHLVQTMRKTRQTSELIEKMGPFFVGYVLARGP
jgi:chlorite dismutase